MIPKDTLSQKRSLHLKGELKYNCYHPLRRECGIARMNLNSRTDCITLTMQERMRLTCCVLPQGKALNVRVYLYMKCTVYLSYGLTLMVINLSKCFEQIAFVCKRTFSSSEAALLLVSTKNRDLWPGLTPEVRDSRTSRNSHAQSRI